MISTYLSKFLAASRLFAFERFFQVVDPLVFLERGKLDKPLLTNLTVQNINIYEKKTLPLETPVNLMSPHMLIQGLFHLKNFPALVMLTFEKHL